MNMCYSLFIKDFHGKLLVKGKVIFEKCVSNEVFKTFFKECSEAQNSKNNAVLENLFACWIIYSTMVWLQISGYQVSVK